jgi:D-3-phosphoglycerate dehydrogenase
LSFETLFRIKYTEAFQYLLKKKCDTSPHIAGWTFESHERLAQVIVNKKAKYFGQVKVEAIDGLHGYWGFFLNQKSQRIMVWKTLGLKQINMVHFCGKTRRK